MSDIYSKHIEMVVRAEARSDCETVYFKFKFTSDVDETTSEVDGTYEGGGRNLGECTSEVGRTWGERMNELGGTYNRGGWSIQVKWMEHIKEVGRMYYASTVYASQCGQE